MWSRLIIEEFYRQGDLEAKFDVEISPLSDRNEPLAKVKLLYLVIIRIFGFYCKSHLQCILGV